MRMEILFQHRIIHRMERLLEVTTTQMQMINTSLQKKKGTKKRTLIILERGIMMRG
ncbi:MAG: hypothetical protein JXB17_11720 [Bacteroidales bacterium]|nr:hypothetical protein [Bacteroidales bacterium]